MSAQPEPCHNVPGQWDASFLAQLLAQLPVGRGTYAIHQWVNQCATRSRVEIIWSPEAVDQLSSIYQYGLVTWTEEIADKYQKQLKTVVEMIAQHPELGKSRNEIALGIRSFPTEAHTILHRATSTAIVTVEIFHSSSDVFSARTEMRDG